MSLLTAARQKQPVSLPRQSNPSLSWFVKLCLTLITLFQSLGYTPDFIQSMKPLLKQVKERGIKVVTNAGGVNPGACAQALSTIATEQGVELSIALVEGDSLMENVSKM